jgi:ariadne-1
MISSDVVSRYYAGDQEALFAEAHLVHPCKKPMLDPPTRVQTPSTATCGAAASPGQEFICEICMLSYAQSEMSGLECGHLFCHECWDSYLRVMVVCEGRAQTISCPATTCDIVVDETTVL